MKIDDQQIVERARKLIDSAKFEAAEEFLYFALENNKLLHDAYYLQSQCLANKRALPPAIRCINSGITIAQTLKVDNDVLRTYYEHLRALEAAKAAQQSAAAAAELAAASQTRDAISGRAYSQMTTGAPAERFIAWMNAPENQATLPLIDGTDRYALFFNPKCGSGSLHTIFAHRTGFIDGILQLFGSDQYLPGSDPYQPLSEYMHEFRTKSYYLSPYFEKHRNAMVSYIENGGGKSWKTFKFVRNPYTRIFSGFLTLMRGPQKPAFMVKEYAEGRCSFRSFVGALAREKETDEWRFNYEVDHHVRRQVFGFELNDGFEFDAVFKIEDGFDKAFSKIDDMLGISGKHALPSADHDRNRTIYNNEHHPAADIGISRSWADVEFTIIDADTIIPNYQHFYDGTLQEIVYKLYEDDFQLYGYKKEIERG